MSHDDKRRFHFGKPHVVADLPDPGLSTRPPHLASVWTPETRQVVGTALRSMGLEQQIAALEARAQSVKESVKHMADEVQAAADATAAIEADVSNVQTALAGQKQAIAELQTQVDDLKAQLGSGGTIDPAALQALTDRLTAADVALDAATG